MSANFLFLPQVITKPNGGRITIEHKIYQEMGKHIKNEVYSNYKNASPTKPDPKSG
jgi:hypothetical protein